MRFILLAALIALQSACVNTSTKVKKFNEEVTCIDKEIEKFGELLFDNEPYYLPEAVLILNDEYSKPDIAYSHQLADSIVSYIYFDSSQNVDSTKCFFTDYYSPLLVIRNNHFVAFNVRTFDIKTETELITSFQISSQFLDINYYIENDDYNYYLETE